MTVKQLIEFLEEHFDPTDEVLHASDNEGNAHNPVFVPINKSFYKSNGRYADLIDVETDGFSPCVILYPGCW
jgi:hypothetical protein